MPHLIAYIDQIGLDAIRDKFIDHQSFSSSLENLVATRFNQVLGEQLVGGRTVVIDHVQTSKSMPTSILVVILAWWDREREQHAEELRHLITDDIRGCFSSVAPRPKITVLIEVVD